MWKIFSGECGMIVGLHPLFFPGRGDLGQHIVNSIALLRFFSQRGKWFHEKIVYLFVLPGRFSLAHGKAHYHYVCGLCRPSRSRLYLATDDGSFYGCSNYPNCKYILK